RLNIALDIVRALKVLQSKKIQHRGMKSANILLTEDLQVKLADFDSSTLEGESNGITRGPLHWETPPRFIGAPYLPADDIYGYGLILWHLITRKIPFSIEDILKDIPDQYPQGLIELASACCHQDPEKRLKIDDILSMLPGIIAHLPELEKKISWSLPQFLQPFSHPKEPEEEFKELKAIQFLSSNPKKADAPTKIYPIFHDQKLSGLKWIDRDCFQEFKQELKFLSILQKCDYIMQLEKSGIYYTQSESGVSVHKNYCLVMEWMPYSLRFMLDSKNELSWTTRIQIALKIAESLKKLEQEKIIHLNLNSDNIWLTKDLQPKLTGFGHAKMHAQIGAEYKPTPSNWTAPEKFVSPAADVFSFGQVLLHLMTRKYPLRTEEISSDCPQDLVKLYFRCCHQEPIKRLPLDYILSHLQKMLDPSPQPLPQPKKTRSLYDIWARLFSRNDAVPNSAVQATPRI
ncbi:MAG: protein kinase, partial [Proteobacteria bacterium]|nr:protein kinase [Pseudomonadota bacterium]